MGIREIENFLGHFRRFSEEYTDLRFSQFERSFNAVGGTLQLLSDSTRQVERETAQRFNIFRVLDRERDEVGTHSRFLAELLDPKGSHGQAHRFLTTFLERCEAKASRRFMRLEGPVESFTWTVRTERWFTSFEEEEEDSRSGRMDIMISSVDASFLLVIENKIGSGETRADQVASYLRWLESQKHWKRPEPKLVYLTVKGDDAKSAPDSPDYIRLSYREDVRYWLTKLLPHIGVGAARLSQLLTQYLEVIDRLDRDRR